MIPIKIITQLVTIAIILYTISRLNDVVIMSPSDISKTRNSHVSIFWSAPFLSGGGYCSEAISLVSAISKQGFDIHIQQHGDSVNQGFINGLSSKVQNFVWSLLNKSDDQKQNTIIEVCHSEPGAWKPASYSTSDCPMFSKKYSYHIGRTMFETDRIPEGWSKKMNKMDEIWVPSVFMKDVFEKGGVKNIRVIGESVDTDFFRPILSVRFDQNIPVFSDSENTHNLTRHFIIDKIFERHPVFAYKTDIFVSVFKWEFRKGWDILLNSYFSSFSQNDNVSLFIVTQEYHESNPIEQQIKELIQKYVKSSKLTHLPHYKIITSYLPETYLPFIYNIATAVVLPSRGEGWGRVAQEAMSCGIPVILTGYGGCLTFVNENNSFPLEISGFKEIAQGAFSGHLLVEPNRTQLIDAMHSVLTNRALASQKGMNARKDMIEMYSEDTMGKILDIEFHRIESIMEDRWIRMHNKHR